MSPSSQAKHDNAALPDRLESPRNEYQNFGTNSEPDPELVHEMVALLGQVYAARGRNNKIFAIEAVFDFLVGHGRPLLTPVRFRAVVLAKLREFFEFEQDFQMQAQRYADLLFPGESLINQ